MDIASGRREDETQNHRFSPQRHGHPEDPSGTGFHRDTIRKHVEALEEARRGPGKSTDEDERHVVAERLVETPRYDSPKRKLGMKKWITLCIDHMNCWLNRNIPLAISKYMWSKP